LNPLIDVVKAGLEGLKRSSPVDLINFQEKDVERFINEKGNITIDHRSLDWVRLP
jgi:hypothetical protein